MAIVTVLSDMGNPFQEDNGDLLTLDTSEIINDEIVETTRNIVKAGQQQYYIFGIERFVGKI